jgi:integrase
MVGVVDGVALDIGYRVDEIKALADACRADEGGAGIRDAALIGILYICGMRRSEIVALDLTDFEVQTGRLTIQNGKGRKARAVYVAGGALAALSAWITFRGDQSGPLFCRIRKGGKMTGERLATQAIYSILKKRAKQAGVRDFSPHDLRRSFVGDMLSRGADIALVARIAGHASVTTTARYDRRPEEAKRAAACLLHYPFKPT